MLYLTDTNLFGLAWGCAIGEQTLGKYAVCLTQKLQNWPIQQKVTRGKSGRTTLIKTRKFNGFYYSNCDYHFGV